jgi:hypothetical protein
MFCYIAPQRKHVYHRVAQDIQSTSPTTLSNGITDHISITHISRVRFTIYTWRVIHLALSRDFSCNQSHTKYTHWATPVISNSVAAACGATSPYCQGSIEPSPECYGYSCYFAMAFAYDLLIAVKAESMRESENFTNIGMNKISIWAKNLL